MSEILSKYGVDFKLSRTQDIDTDMDSKVAMCNKYAPDLVVDIHFNAGGGQALRYITAVWEARQKHWQTILIQK